MIYKFIPYRTDKNLFKAYDECMALIKPDDYAVFIDHDAMFCGCDWLQTIEDGIKETQGVLFTGWTNRVNCMWQVDVYSPEGNDILRHRKYDDEGFGEWDQIGRTDGQLFSGFFMVIKKSHWENMKPFKNKMLGLDNEIHKKTRDMGERLYQIGVYLYHWYRDGNERNKDHLL